MRIFLKTLIGISAHASLATVTILVGLFIPLMEARLDSTLNNFAIKWLDATTMLYIIYVPCFLDLATMTFFIIYTIKQSRHSNKKKIIWVLLLLFLSIISNPVFFWVEFVRRPNSEPLFE